MEQPPQEPGSLWLPPQPPGPQPAGQAESPPSPPPDRASTDPSQPSPPPPPPPPPPPAQPQQAQPPQQPAYNPYGYGAPVQQPYGYGYGYTQPGYQQGYYGQPQQYGGWQQQQAWAPPGQWPQQPAYAHPSYGPEPDNDPAIAALTLALSGLGLLVFSAGFSAAIVSPAAGGFAIYYGRKGMEKVDKGETRRYRGAAKAGFILGIVTVVLSIAAAAIWIIVIASDPDVFDESSAVIRAALDA